MRISFIIIFFLSCSLLFSIGRFDRYWQAEYTAVYGDIPEVRAHYGARSNGDLGNLSFYSKSFLWRGQLWIIHVNRGIYQLDLEDSSSVRFYSIPGITHAESQDNILYLDSYIDLISLEWDQNSQSLLLKDVLYDCLLEDPRALATAMIPIDHVSPQLDWNRDELVVDWTVEYKRRYSWLPPFAKYSAPPEVLWARIDFPRRFCLYQDKIYYFNDRGIYWWNEDTVHAHEIAHEGSLPDIGTEMESYDPYPVSFLGDGWMLWTFPSMNYPRLYHLGSGWSSRAMDYPCEVNRGWIVFKSPYAYGSMAVYSLDQWISENDPPEEPFWQTYYLGDPVDYWFGGQNWYVLEQQGASLMVNNEDDSPHAPPWISQENMTFHGGTLLAAHFENERFYRLYRLDDLSSLVLQVWQYGEEGFSLQEERSLAF